VVRSAIWTRLRIILPENVTLPNRLSYGLDAVERVVLRMIVRREQLMELVAVLAPCRIGIEALRVGT
jgi:hypothetical protein